MLLRAIDTTGGMIAVRRAGDTMVVAVRVLYLALDLFMNNCITPISLAGLIGIPEIFVALSMLMHKQLGTCLITPDEVIERIP